MGKNFRCAAKFGTLRKVGWRTTLELSQSFKTLRKVELKFGTLRKVFGRLPFSVRTFAKFGTLRKVELTLRKFPNFRKDGEELPLRCKVWNFAEGVSGGGELL